jgi:hypothetical protein
MSLTTFSKFYYGHEVTSDNNVIEFNEGGPTLTAAIQPGFYTLTEYALAVAQALTDAGALTYTGSVSRSSRKITISAGSNFALLVSSGTAGSSAFPMMGFSGADLTGASTYTGNNGSGYVYSPQFILQDHVSSDNFKRTIQAQVNESADGTTEVVRFGVVRFVRFNIMMITNISMDGIVIRNNPTGVSEANQFMNYITKIAPIEFMPDELTVATFQKIQLESTQQSKDGIDYTLKEFYDKGLPGIFETGVLTFRVLE